MTNCVVSLPKSRMMQDDKGCRKFTSSGEYPDTEVLGNELEILSQVLTENINLESAYLVSNVDLMLSVKCNGTEVFRLISGPAEPSPVRQIGCEKCKTGQTLSMTVCGPCPTDFFVQLKAMKC